MAAGVGEDAGGDWAEHGREVHPAEADLLAGCAGPAGLLRARQGVRCAGVRPDLLQDGRLRPHLLGQVHLLRGAGGDQTHTGQGHQPQPSGHRRAGQGHLHLRRHGHRLGRAGPPGLCHQAHHPLQHPLHADHAAVRQLSRGAAGQDELRNRAGQTPVYLPAGPGGGLEVICLQRLQNGWHRPQHSRQG